MKVLYWVIVALAVGGLFNAGPAGEVFGWILLVGAVIVALMVKKGGQILEREAADAQEQPRHAVAQATKRSRKTDKPVHTPPPPVGNASEPWSPKTKQFEVAGEFYRLDSIRAHFHGQRISAPEGAELRDPATLVPDPLNPYDTKAVAVFVRGHHVGYLERNDARVYHQPIVDLTSTGVAVTVPSRQWARSQGSKTFARVSLSLPEPGGFTPVNPLPDRAVILPTGSTIQVTKEDEHMQQIAPLLDPRGAKVALAATLHSIVDIRPRTAVDAVQVQVDGEPVGILSPTQTANLLPLVRYINERGGVPVVRAVLRGNSIKADMVLHVAKAHDVDPAWLEALGPVSPRNEAREPDWN